MRSFRNLSKILNSKNLLSRDGAFNAHFKEINSDYSYKTMVLFADNALIEEAIEYVIELFIDRNSPIWNDLQSSIKLAYELAGEDNPRPSIELFESYHDGVFIELASLTNVIPSILQKFCRSQKISLNGEIVIEVGNVTPLIFSSPDFSFLWKLDLEFSNDFKILTITPEIRYNGIENSWMNLITGGLTYSLGFGLASGFLIGTAIDYGLYKGLIENEVLKGLDNAFEDLFDEIVTVKNIELEEFRNSENQIIGMKIIYPVILDEYNIEIPDMLSLKFCNQFLRLIDLVEGITGQELTNDELKGAKFINNLNLLSKELYRSRN